jgi:hypothetical protein
MIVDAPLRSNMHTYFHCSFLNHSNQNIQNYAFLFVCSVPGMQQMQRFLFSKKRKVVIAEAPLLGLFIGLLYLRAQYEYFERTRRVQ